MKTIQEIRKESSFPTYRKTDWNTLVYNEEYVEWLEEQLIKYNDSSLWKPILGSDKEDYKKATQMNCLIKFDNESICRYNDKWPFAIATHYKNTKIDTKIDNKVLYSLIEEFRQWSEMWSQFDQRKISKKPKGLDEFVAELSKKLDTL